MKTNTKRYFLIIITVMAFIIFSLQTAYSVYQQRKLSYEQMNNLLIKQAEKESAILGANLDGVAQNAFLLSKIIQNNKNNDFTLYNNVIKESLANNELLFGMGYWYEPYYIGSDTLYYGPYIYKDDRQNLKSTFEYSSEEYDYFNQDWYINGMASPDNVHFTGPYYDENLDTIFLTATSHILKNNKKVGLVSVDITLREIEEYVNNIYVNEYGTVFLLTSQGEYWGKSGTNNNLKTNIYEEDSQSLLEIGQNIINANESLSQFNKEDRSLYISSAIGKTNLKIVLVMPENRIYEPIYDTIKNNSIYFLISIGLFILILNLFLTRRMENPIKKILNDAMLVYEMEDVENSSNLKEHLSFDEMIRFLERLLHDRNKNVKLLSERNQEILLQKEKIIKLFEESKDMNQSLKTLLYEVENGYVVTVKALSNAIEANDYYTKGHCENVTYYALIIGKAMELSSEELKYLEYASLLHDIGKIGIPSAILNKPSSLTNEEFTLIKEHPRIGYNIIKDVNFLEKSSLIVYQHHERPDGRGYPQGLKEGAIEPLAMIISIADAFDAMTRERAYRKNPLSFDVAIKILEENKGTQFNTEMVDIFVKELENL